MSVMTSPASGPLTTRQVTGRDPAGAPSRVTVTVRVSGIPTYRVVEDGANVTLVVDIGVLAAGGAVAVSTGVVGELVAVLVDVAVAAAVAVLVGVLVAAAVGALFGAVVAVGGV